MKREPRILPENRGVVPSWPLRGGVSSGFGVYNGQNRKVSVASQVAKVVCPGHPTIFVTLQTTGAVRLPSDG